MNKSTQIGIHTNRGQACDLCDFNSFFQDHFEYDQLNRLNWIAEKLNGVGAQMAGLTLAERAMVQELVDGGHVVSDHTKSDGENGRFLGGWRKY